jgi:hypothetical protein
MNFQKEQIKGKQKIKQLGTLNMNMIFLYTSLSYAKNQQLVFT